MSTTINTSGLEQQIREYAVARLNELADVFVERAQQNASKRTGEMADSIEHDDAVPTGNGATCTARCTSDHAQYQEEGTGIYGPEGRPITPHKTGGVLVFDWPAAGGIVFARSVRGSEPTHFWQRTRDEWSIIVGSL